MNGIGTGGFPIDLVLFGMIAAFLVLRLRSILGRRTGYERTAQQPGPSNAGSPAGPIIEGKAEPAPNLVRPLPDPASAPGQALSRMQSVDHSFSAAAFLDGAERAFRMIVEAYAGGNRDTLRRLLSEEMYHAFDQAIVARESAGETQRTEIRGIQSDVIDSATLRGTVADITVRFVSDQISLVLGREGQIVSGTDAVTEIVDIWTFERDLALRDPTWRLVAAQNG